MKTQEEKLFQSIQKEISRQLKIESEGKPDNLPDLKKVSDLLDEYYFIEKTKLLCTYLSYSQIINPKHFGFSKEDLRLMPEIINESEQRFRHKSMFKIYLGIKQLIESINEEGDGLDELFVNIIELASDEELKITDGERSRIFSYLTNFGIRQMNQGKTDYRPLAFITQVKMIQLQFGIKKSRKKVLPASLFINVVKTALLLKHNPGLFQKLNDLQLNSAWNAFEWTNKFMSSYKANLNKEGLSVCYPYCPALVLVEQGNWQEAYKIMRDLNSVKGIFMKMTARLLQLRIVYEILLSKPELLEKDGLTANALLESFRGLVRHEKDQRKKQAYQIDFFRTFEKLFRKLLSFHNHYFGKVYNEKDPRFLKEKSKLLKNISAVEYSYGRWFSEKVNFIN